MDGLFQLEIVSQDDGMFVVKTGCVDGNGLKCVEVIAAEKLRHEVHDDPHRLKREIAALSARIAELEAQLATANQENETLRAHNALLREAIEKYGRHRDDCGSRVTYRDETLSRTSYPCTCGFDTAREGGAL